MPRWSMPMTARSSKCSGWRAGLRLSLMLALLAGAALALGLAGTTLRTGWIAPLDWLLPGGAAMLLMLLLMSRRAPSLRWRDVACCWSLAALPAMLFCLLAGNGRPWLATALLGAGLGLVGLGGMWAQRLGATGRRLMPGLVLAALLGAAALAPYGVVASRGANMDAGVAPEARARIGIMAAVPLQGLPLGAAQGVAPVEAIGRRSPLWHMLEARFQPRALDALDMASLDGLEALLLIQPRQLAPAELVALDGWVRDGGRAVILADPLLHWPDHRSLAHPARAPLTSLLDPLLHHWGLELEPAAMAQERDPVERRWLKDGGLVQLAGASRFRARKSERAAACRLRDEGLIADCGIGRGTALLIADADWIADPLWTLDPDDPAQRAAWTSDAVDLLDGWLRGVAPRFVWHGTWLADRDVLLQSLRLCLIMLSGLALLAGLVAWRPMAARPNHDTNMDQMKNNGETISNSS